jgi:hypothetical protein
MCLNDIKLSSYTLQQLYASTLVEEVLHYLSLGYNKKNILVVVNYAEVPHLPDEQLAFLTQLLGACKLSMNDVAIINLNNYEGVDYESILLHFESKIVLLFGIAAENFGFPFAVPEYQVQNFAGRVVMHSPALQLIQNDKPAKGKLWLSLRKIFNV